MGDDVAVKVAIRVRPQMPREQIDCCRVCTNFVPGEPQIILGTDKAFTYDQVFDLTVGQRQIFNTVIRDLVDSCFNGYNSTILAYGQTGSGKTYTMGTQFDDFISEDQRGLIPRAVDHLFNTILERKNAAKEEGLLPPEFKVTAQFMELYNDEILDLLSPSGESKNKKSNLKIHEEVNTGEIYVDGMSTQTVGNTEEVLMCLKQGALCRTTASTNMNAVSSRSHAMFALKMHQTRSVPSEEGSDAPEFENLTAKLVFVDLAGSERLKRTGATGDRAKEGISINGGLLALGNVISALGDEKRKASHVPYRDSKLTRLLQDSLGGNSQTLMVACVSPSDRDFMETLNTLKYANRAKNIKNKVVVNQDKTSRIINTLREENMKLQAELMEYRMGQRTGEEGGQSDLFTENTMLRADNDKLRLRIKSLKEAQDAKDEVIAELRAKALCSEMTASGETDMTEMVQGYLKEIETLRSQLLESQSSAMSSLRTPLRAAPSTPSSGPTNVLNSSIDEVIREARCDLEKTMAKRSRLAQMKDLEVTRMGGDTPTLEVTLPATPDNDRGAPPPPPADNNREGGNENKENECEEMEVEEGEEDQGSSGESGEHDEDEEDEEEDEEEGVATGENLAHMEESLADLAGEINIKQKLLDELEKSQKKILAMRQQYEEKLQLLQNQIQVTCDERDKVLSNLSSRDDSNKNKEQIKTTRDHYAKKLKNMETEVKRLKTAHREHDRLVKSNKDYEKNVKNLQGELTQMKKNKVKLMRQMKEENSKAKKCEQKKQQEIIKLQREKQKQVSQIRKLQLEQKSKEMVLKRKQQEIKVMKKQQQVLNVKRAQAKGVPVAEIQAAADERHNKRLSSQYSSFSARQKWNQFEKKICQNIIRKHTVTQMEMELDRLVKDREKLEKDLDKAIKTKDKLLKERNPNSDELQELDEQIEGLGAQVEYLQDSINDHQGDIVEMMDGRESGDTLDLQDIIGSSSLSDCKYLLEHFITFATNKGLAAAQSNAKIKETEATVKSLKQALEETEQRLLDNQASQEKIQEVTLASAAVAAADQTTIMDFAATPCKTYSMLYATPGKSFFPQLNSASPPVTLTRSESLTNNKSRVDSPTDFGGLAASPNGQLMSSSTPSLLTTPSAINPKTDKRTRSGSRGGSPARVRAKAGNGEGMINLLERGERIRKRISHSDNVFERLQGGMEPSPEGTLVTPPESENGTANPTSLHCVSLAKGHTSSVQGVSVAGKIMVSGSTDGTIRVWDLNDGKEVQRAFYSEQVKRVVYSAPDSVVYAITNQSFKAWDIRTDPKTCRSAQLAEFPSALLLPPGSQFIYFSTGISVRSWNIGQWTGVGVLHGHSGHVMCLEHVAVEDKKYIVTGSRDHFCKIYDATDGIVSGRMPLATLNPPHFDGIECVVWGSEHLYSGSRDTTIKKWHLQTRKEKGGQRPAHKDRVQALAHIPELRSVVSASRDGVVKLWREDSFGDPKSDPTKSLIAEVDAHPGSSIQDLQVSGDHIYTASADSTIKIWSIPQPQNSDEMTS